MIWKNKLVARPIQVRRAVSPVIAIILLIGLTVAAGSLLFITVIPMFEPKADISFTHTDYYTDVDLPVWNVSKDAYVIEFTVMNGGTKAVTIQSVELVKNNGNTINHRLHTPEYLEEEFQPLGSFDFLLTFVRVTPPPVFKIRVTLDGGQVYYSQLVTLS